MRDLSPLTCRAKREKKCFISGNIYIIFVSNKEVTSQRPNCWIGQSVQRRVGRLTYRFGKANFWQSKKTRKTKLYLKGFFLNVERMLRSTTDSAQRDKQSNHRQQQQKKVNKIAQKRKTLVWGTSYNRPVAITIAHNNPKYDKNSAREREREKDKTKCIQKILTDKMPKVFDSQHCRKECNIPNKSNREEATECESTRAPAILYQ